MQFRINLATRTYISRKKLKVALASSLAILLLLLIIQIRSYAHNVGEISLLQSMKTANDSVPKKKEPGFSDKDYTKLTSDITFANDIIEKKTFDWIHLLNNLEDVVPKGLALTSVEPNSKELTLKLTGVSQDFMTMRHFMENLEDSNNFSYVYLFRQDKAQAADNPKAITFVISCKFVLDKKP